MFVKKNSIEVVNIEKDIQIVGLSLEKYGFPKQAEKLGEMWGTYESKYRSNLKNVITPVVNYGFWFFKQDNDYDYLVGSAVTDFNNIDNELTIYSIPASRFIKVTFNAINFENLVCGEDLRNSFKIAEKYAVESNLLIKTMPPFPITAIEVYPHELMSVGKDNGPKWGLALDSAFVTTPITEYPEMYTLTPIE